MTVRISKPVLGVAAVFAVGAVAYLIARPGGSGVSPNETTSLKGPAEQQLPCNKTQARKVSSHGRFASRVLALPGVTTKRVLSVYDANAIGCVDLTRDGLTEMVVQLDCCTSGALLPWAIFQQRDGGWAPAFIRTRVPEPTLTVRGHLVHESSPVYSKGDALCCATRQLTRTVRWTSKQFVYEPTLEPAVSKHPTAGACGGLRPGSRVGTVRIYPDTPQPRCLQVHPGQRLRFVNKTSAFGFHGEVVTVGLARFRAKLASGEATTFEENVGSYLAPGDHIVRVSYYAGGAGPEVLLLKR
jgi:hypothetical protein